MAIEPGLWEEDERKRKRRNLIGAAVGIAFYVVLTVALVILTKA